MNVITRAEPVPSQAPAHFLHETRGLAWNRGGLHALAVRDDLTRITRSNGEIIGYVDRLDRPEGHAYRARRYIPRERRFVELPTVWSPDDAMDSLRW